MVGFKYFSIFCNDLKRNSIFTISHILWNPETTCNVQHTTISKSIRLLLRCINSNYRFGWEVDTFWTFNR
ncbi:Uncharacterised protein [Vibrio cholerae]|nr:Uncharacterised protein [Vibrio cholerae]CSC82277.1 Uncharacterised protein [Vibrio cholerae]